MLLDLEENEDNEPDKELKESLEPKVTESATTKLKRKRLTWPKRK
jgi:hypothetical protein